jgi:hypothetical protein
MHRLKDVNIWELWYANYVQGIQKYSDVTETVFFGPVLYDTGISYSHYNVLSMKHRAHSQYAVVIKCI